MIISCRCLFAGATAAVFSRVLRGADQADQSRMIVRSPRPEDLEMTLTMDDLKKFPRAELVGVLECGGIEESFTNRTFQELSGLSARSAMGDGRERVFETSCKEPLSNRVPLTAVSARLRHSDVNITTRIYGHMLPDDDSRAPDAWETVINRQVH